MPAGNPMGIPRAWCVAGRSVVLVDVRREEERAVSMLQGAITRWRSSRSEGKGPCLTVLLAS